MKTTHWGIVTCPWFKPFKQHLNSFRLSKLLHSQSVPIKHTNNFDTAFPNNLDCSICDTKFLTLIFFFFPFSVSHSTLTFPSTIKTFLLLVAVAMLLIYQSPVNWRSIDMGGTLINKVNYCYYSRREICIAA